MLSLDGTLLVQLVNFIVVLAIINVIFFKPVGAAIARVTAVAVQRVAKPYLQQFDVAHVMPRCGS